MSTKNRKVSFRELPRDVRERLDSIFINANYANPFSTNGLVEEQVGSITKNPLFEPVFVPEQLSREERLERFEKTQPKEQEQMRDPVVEELEFEKMQRPPRVLRGQSAIEKVAEMEGRELTLPEKTVIEEEGFVDELYKDTKGVVTYGVGQTGKYIDMSFGDSFREHEEDAKRLIPNYDNLPEIAQAAIMSAAYRGDLQQSPKFRKLFNAGDYEKAADEFLDNDDYRESLEEGTGVAGRMERVAEAVRNLQG